MEGRSPARSAGDQTSPSGKRAPTISRGRGGRSRRVRGEEDCLWVFSLGDTEVRRSWSRAWDVVGIEKRRHGRRFSIA